jgi:hypothetical protein
MNPIFETNYLGFWVKVFPTRVDFKNGPGTKSIPINQVASVQLGMWGYMQIILETTGGVKYKIPCTEKKEVQEAIYQAQDKLTSSQSSVSGGVADELEKLNKLKEKGILSEKEFEKQKEKLLS